MSLIKVYKFAGWWHIWIGNRVVMTNVIHRRYWERICKIWSNEDFVFCIDLPFWFMRVWR